MSLFIMTLTAGHACWMLQYNKADHNVPYIFRNYVTSVSTIIKDSTSKTAMMHTRVTMTRHLSVRTGLCTQSPHNTHDKVVKTRY